MEPQAKQTNSAVPPWTTTNKLITSDVPATKPEKHPGWVAAGKRVAGFNRRAREAKKLQQQQQIQQEAPTPKPEQTEALKDSNERTNNNNGNT